MFGLYALMDVYYRRAFGRVVSARGLLDWVMGSIGAIAGLAAFIIDVTLRLPVSAVGLILAASILFDYLMLVRIGKAWYMSFSPIFALLIELVSVLPALGLDGWWQVLGIRSGWLGVQMASGVILVAASIISHFYFTHALAQEARYGRSV